MPTIFITDETHRVNVPVVHNGRVVTIPVGQDFDVDDEIFNALSHSNVRFRVIGKTPAKKGGDLVPTHTEPTTPIRSAEDIAAEEASSAPSGEEAPAATVEGRDGKRSARRGRSRAAKGSK
jgi:hypothetical protein